MIKKTTVIQISVVLFLGGLVAFLIGHTLSPRFANAAGGKDCSGLAGQFFACGTTQSAFSLQFFAANESSKRSLSVESSPIFVGNTSVEIDADCVCAGGVKVVCVDVQEDDVILLGQVDNSSLTEGKIIVPGQGPVRYECETDL